jgi:hypothetical protein
MAGETRAGETGPELRALVVEASHALALLDAARLEELARSCEALNRELSFSHADMRLRSEMARQAREAAKDMAVFGRVLDVTRANLNVMNRLREMRMGRLEYTVQVEGEAAKGRVAEDGDGNH